MHGIHARQRHGHQRMPHLVIGHSLSLVRVEQPVFLLEACDDALDGSREIVHRHGRRLAARCEQRRLIDEIRQIRSGEARC